MINEVYSLKQVLQQKKITTEHTHVKYKLIPNVTKNAPCVHVIFDDGHISKVESLQKEQAAQIRKYGSNHGPFPALNLAPLYVITAEDDVKMISDLVQGKTTEFDINKIRQLCKVNNWSEKFLNKYRISMQKTPRELTELFRMANISFPQLDLLIKEVKSFADAEIMHRELEEIAFAMLEQKRKIIMAFQILFFWKKRMK